MKLYHYTTIDALALILKNKSILFNRLDIVDDLEEGQISSLNINMSKYVFVSCWTENDEENIPLWKMYTDNGIGVRIGLDYDMFRDYHTSIGKFEDGFLSGNITLKLPINELFNEKYIITPFAKSSDILKKIEYIEDYANKTNNLVREESTPNNKVSLHIDNDNLGRYKHQRWSFEEESRFVLVIWPRVTNASLFDMGEWMFQSLKEGIDLPIRNYFLHLKDGVWDNMEIRLSPNIPESKKLIIEALRDKYAPNATIQKSSLDNYVKLK